jgi:two-component system, LytTR family, sensor kinase
MSKLRKIYKIGIHITGWNLCYLLNFLFLEVNNLDYSFNILLLLFIIYIAVFYTGYYFISQFLLKKKIILFFLLSITIVLSATLAMHNVKLLIRPAFILQFEKRFPKTEFTQIPERFTQIPERFFDKKLSIFNRRNILDIYVILLFLISSVLIRFIQKWLFDEKQKILLLKNKTDAELLFLKQQINPHFLFNSLNSIYSLANKKSNLTTDAILKLSTILRYVLYHSQKNFVPVKDEINTLEDYIELQKLRITQKVSVNFSITGEPDFYQIEPLLILPFVENAFKYGVDSVNKSFIDIKLDILDDELNLYVLNKIIPNKEINKDESGIGLNNIRRRLDLLYPDNYNLDVNQVEDVFSIKLKLNLKNEMYSN